MQRFIRDGKYIGVLYDDGVFRKEVDHKRHYYRGLDAWGIDENILKRLPEGTKIRLRDRDGVIYATTRETYLTGFRREYGDYGAQLFLWHGLFDTERDGVIAPSTYLPEWLAMLELWESV